MRHAEQGLARSFWGAALHQPGTPGPEQCVPRDMVDRPTFVLLGIAPCMHNPPHPTTSIPPPSILPNQQPSPCSCGNTAHARVLPWTHSVVLTPPPHTRPHLHPTRVKSPVELAHTVPERKACSERCHCPLACARGWSRVSPTQQHPAGALRAAGGEE